VNDTAAILARGDGSSSHRVARRSDPSKTAGEEVGKGRHETRATGVRGPTTGGAEVRHEVSRASCKDGGTTFLRGASLAMMRYEYTVRDRRIESVALRGVIP